MASNPRQTGAKTAKAASKVLRNPESRPGREGGSGKRAVANAEADVARPGGPGSTPARQSWTPPPYLSPKESPL